MPISEEEAPLDYLTILVNSLISYEIFIALLRILIKKLTLYSRIGNKKNVL